MKCPRRVAIDDVSDEMNEKDLVELKGSREYPLEMSPSSRYTHDSRGKGEKDGGNPAAVFSRVRRNLYVRNVSEFR